MKSEYKIISNIIEENTRVLDVGCDDGTLMELLELEWSCWAVTLDHNKDPCSSVW